jgi:hypothetical protein
MNRYANSLRGAGPDLSRLLNGLMLALSLGVIVGILLAY